MNRTYDFFEHYVAPSRGLNNNRSYTHTIFDIKKFFRVNDMECLTDIIVPQLRHTLKEFRLNKALFVDVKKAKTYIRRISKVLELPILEKTRYIESKEGVYYSESSGMITVTVMIEAYDFNWDWSLSNMLKKAIKDLCNGRNPIA